MEDSRPLKKPNRGSWNHAAIHSLAVESEPLEVAFGEAMAKRLEGFCVMPHMSRFNRHDFVVTLDLPNTPDVQLTKPRVLVELECGKTQSQWISSIMDNKERWKYGLNVLSRKVTEGQHYDIFIKHNAACNSFFACTYDFVKREGCETKLWKHSLNFATDSVVYSIPWEWYDKQSDQFCCDDWGKLGTMLRHVLESKTKQDTSLASS